MLFNNLKKQRRFFAEESVEFLIAD